MRWAVGGEVAYEDRRNVYDYRDIFNGSHEADDVLGSGGTSASGERQRWSVNAKVSLPLRDDWDLELVGRHDDYDNVGGRFSRQIASRYQFNEAIALRVSWNGGSRPPDLYLLNAREVIDYPFVCDTRTLTGNPEDCDEYQVERVSGGNPNLEPDEAESFSVGAVIDLGPFSLSADWFKIALSSVPARLSAQSTIDLEAEGWLPPGAAVIREGDLIRRIESPWVNSGQTDVEGLNFGAQADWKTDWGDLTLGTYWSRVTRYERRVADEVQPVAYPRDRVRGSLHASRGRFTANWSIYAVSGYWNERETGRYKAWVGHDILLRWRDAFGWNGMELTGGILNVADRGPSIDPTVPGIDGADARLDSIRGRTISLTAKVSF